MPEAKKASPSRPLRTPLPTLPLHASPMGPSIRPPQHANQFFLEFRRIAIIVTIVASKHRKNVKALPESGQHGRLVVRALG